MTLNNFDSVQVQNIGSQKTEHNHILLEQQIYVSEAYYTPENRTVIVTLTHRIMQFCKIITASLASSWFWGKQLKFVLMLQRHPPQMWVRMHVIGQCSVLPENVTSQKTLNQIQLVNVHFSSSLVTVTHNCTQQWRSSSMAACKLYKPSQNWFQRTV